MGGCVGACVSSWYFCVLFGYWLYFVKLIYMYACMHLFVCACMGVRACVRICVYVYAYLCNVCVWGAGQWWGGGGGGRGRGGEEGRCARVRIHTCHYGCSHLLIYFVFLYVSIDICGYFYM